MNLQLAKFKNFDLLLCGTVLVLVLFGVTAIRSAGIGNIEIENHYVRQMIFGGLGFVIMLILSAIDYHYWLKLSNFLFLFIVILLFFLNIVAKSVFGSARWFNLFMVNIQPSEIAKIVIVIFLSNLIGENKEKIKELKFILLCIMSVFFIVIWVLLQPNLSTSIVLLATAFSIIWFAGMRMKHLIILSISALLVIVISLPLLISSKLLKPYQLDRVTTFLDPDPNARHGDTYNVEQAIISIGSGGIWGQGYGHGTQVQLHFLKVRHSDFIFSTIANEFGFVGAILLMTALVFVICRCLNATRLAQDRSGSLICFGIAIMFTLQVFVNIGVNLNLLPVTGLTLPFVSYGGSSLIINFAGVGLIESVLVHKIT